MGLMYFCAGIRGQILCFRVMGVITFNRKHFLNTDPLGIAPAQVCVCGRGEGKLGFFSGHFRIFGGITTI